MQGVFRSVYLRPAKKAAAVEFLEHLEIVSFLEKQFDALDEDKSGFIDGKELDAMVGTVLKDAAETAANSDRILRLYVKSHPDFSAADDEEAIALARAEFEKIAKMGDDDVKKVSHKVLRDVEKHEGRVTRVEFLRYALAVILAIHRPDLAELGHSVGVGFTYEDAVADMLVDDLAAGRWHSMRIPKHRVSAARQYLRNIPFMSKVSIEFDKFDEDGSGEVDGDEVAKLMHGVVGTVSKDILEDASEMRHLTEHTAKEAGDAAKAALEELASASFSDIEKQLQHVVDDVDSNHDHKISRTEFLRLALAIHLLARPDLCDAHEIAGAIHVSHSHFQTIVNNFVADLEAGKFSGNSLKPGMAKEAASHLKAYKLKPRIDATFETYDPEGTKTIKGDKLDECLTHVYKSSIDYVLAKEERLEKLLRCFGQEVNDENKAQIKGMYEERSKDPSKFLFELKDSVCKDLGVEGEITYKQFCVVVLYGYLTTHHMELLV